MSCRNLPFLSRLEELIGYYISPYTNERIPLVDIGELQHFEIGQVLVLNDRCRPMMGYLPDYSKYDFGTDGNDVSIEMPVPHDKIERKLFGLEKAMEKAKSINAPIIEQRKQETKQESDGLRASILEKLAAQRRKADENEPGTPTEVDTALPFWSPFGKDSDEDDDTDSLIARIDAKIAELEAEEAREKESASDTDESLSVMDLFRQGDYLKAAQQSIVQASILDNISSKNNIAFLIRFGDLDSSKLSAPFSLKIPDLLKDGLEAKEPYSMVNYALYEIKAKHFKKAADLLTQLSAEDWETVAPFWIDEVFDKHEQDPEGALIALLASSNSKSIVIHDDLIPKMLEIARDRFSDFMDSPHFKKVYKESPKETTPIPDKGSDLSAMLDQLLSDDEDDEETQSSDGDESLGFADLKAQLQKKIQEKLKQSAEDPDEDDED